MARPRRTSSGTPTPKGRRPAAKVAVAAVPDAPAAQAQAPAPVADPVDTGARPAGYVVFPSGHVATLSDPDTAWEEALAAVCAQFGTEALQEAADRHTAAKVVGVLRGASVGARGGTHHVLVISQRPGSGLALGAANQYAAALLNNPGRVPYGVVGIVNVEAGRAFVPAGMGYSAEQVVALLADDIAPPADKAA